MRITSRVGVKLLLNMTGIKKNSKSIVVENVDCSKCPYSKDFLNEEFNRKVKEGVLSPDKYDLFMEYLHDDSVCLNCHCNIQEAKVIYDNEKNKFQLENMPKLTRLQILLMIYLHFKCNSHGFVFDIDIEDISNDIECSLESIKRNLKELSDKGYIGVTVSKEVHFGLKRKSKKYSIAISNYSTYHHTKEQRGKGYLYFSMHLFKTLLSVKNINELRIIIREFILQEINQYHNTKEVINSANGCENLIDETQQKIHAYKNIEKEVSVTHQYITDCLPHYNYKSKIHSLIPAMKKFFNVMIEDDNIKIVPHEKYNTKLHIEKMRIKNFLKFKDFLIELYKKQTMSKVNLIHPNTVNNIYNVVLDLTSMSIQYGYKVVYNSLNNIKDLSNIENLGGYVRTILEC